MNRTKSLLACVTALGVTLLVGVSRTAAQDPVVVNPKTIHVKTENSRVRVLEAEIPPGGREEMHSHPASVIYVVAGGRMRSHAVDGTTKETEYITGDAILRDPLTHWAENIGTTTVRLIVVELKPAGDKQ